MAAQQQRDGSQEGTGGNRASPKTNRDSEKETQRRGPGGRASDVSLSREGKDAQGCIGALGGSYAARPLSDRTGRECGPSPDGRVARVLAAQVVRSEARLLSPGFVDGLLDPPFKRMLSPFHSGLKEPQELVHLPVGVEK